MLANADAHHVQFIAHLIASGDTRQNAQWNTFAPLNDDSSSRSVSTASEHRAAKFMQWTNGRFRDG
jgi:hypothetical protein